MQVLDELLLLVHLLELLELVPLPLPDERDWLDALAPGSLDVRQHRHARRLFLLLIFLIFLQFFFLIILV